MDRDISLDFLLRIFKKTWWKIAIVALAVVILVATVTHFFIPKKYSSSIEFYVVNTNTNYDYTTSSLLSASAYLINDYVSIMKSDYMLDQFREDLVGQGYNADVVTNDLLRSMIQSSSQSDTSVFTVTVVHTNPAFAYDVAQTIARLAPSGVTDIAKPDSLTYENLAKKIYSVISYYNKLEDDGGIEVKEKEINKALEDGTISGVSDSVSAKDLMKVIEYYNEQETDGGLEEVTEAEIAKLLESNSLGLNARLNCFEMLTPPVEDENHDSPNIVTYSALGGVIAAVATYLFFLARHLFELNISSEDDIKKMIDRPLIGTIPHWEITNRK